LNSPPRRDSVDWLESQVFRTRENSRGHAAQGDFTHGYRQFARPGAGAEWLGTMTFLTLRVRERVCDRSLARKVIRAHPTGVDPLKRVPRTASGRGRLHAGAVLAAFLLCTSTGRAQDVTESSLKAAFIYNFAKFTEWPEDVLPATATFSACVLGDGQIREALERIVKGRQLSGRGISVSQVQLQGKLRSCHLLYVSSVTAAQVAEIVATVRGAPVLTIGDGDQFARQGGIAQMFVENGKMRFDLNLEIARISRLQLSSKLLALAVHVHDGRKAAAPPGISQLEQVPPAPGRRPVS
jgi:hypothetical protein